MSELEREELWRRRLWVALLFIGAGLRLWQYLARTSLWIDEIALVENVLHRTLRQLVSQPLYLDQLAPPLFLAGLKGTAAAFGDGELALRLLPQLAALASVPL